MEHMLKTIADKMNLQLHAKRAEGSEQVAAGSSAEAPWRKTEFSDLPEICIAMMLACLSPVEVAKLACVSRSFLDASESDLVWERFLPPPPYIHKLLAVHPNPPSQFACKEVFHHLCQPFVSSNHIQGYWLDRRTGGLNMSLSSSGLVITWSENENYWQWREDRASMFPLVAELKSVCWFEAKGEIVCTLPPGTYTLSWRILFLENFGGWTGQPVHFIFSKNDGVDIESKCHMSPGQSMPVVPGYNLPKIREVADDWREFDVGDFVVERGEEMTLLKFQMLEITGGWWKSGLCLDGVVVQPTNTIQRRSPSTIAEQSLESEPFEGPPLGFLWRFLPGYRSFQRNLGGQ
ncbi:unnamed protein product [Sphagnum tenellum]